MGPIGQSCQPQGQKKGLNYKYTFSSGFAADEQTADRCGNQPVQSQSRASTAISLMHYEQIALTPGVRYLGWRFGGGSIFLISQAGS